MRKYFVFFAVFAFLSFGCAHHAVQNSPVMQSFSQANLEQPDQSKPPLPDEKPEEVSRTPENGIDDEYLESYRPDDAGNEEQNLAQRRFTIADPFEPFNRAMFVFNDRLYFWVLKPLAQGYRKILPESARVSVSNFFSNAAFPVRFFNCILQANFPGAASELGRFMLNTLVGFGGLFDPASEKEINLGKCEEDFGQTLGVYGIGHGFYINWPVFGPSSPRDTIGKVADGFLNPFMYVEPWYTSAGAKTLDTINDTSFRIGDYETLKESAIDPYVAMRDGYVQYRYNKVKRRGRNLTATVPEE